VAAVKLVSFGLWSRIDWGVSTEIIDGIELEAALRVTMSRQE
jgi:hypothetical protein